MYARIESIEVTKIIYKHKYEIQMLTSRHVNANASASASASDSAIANAIRFSYTINAYHAISMWSNDPFMERYEDNTQTTKSNAAIKIESV